MKSNVDIAVCVCTYRRPKMLEQLLLSISSLTIPQNANVTLIVIDNDVIRSAEPVFEMFSFKFPAHYHVESSSGLDLVRNRALEEAIELGSNYLAFMDDDETVHSEWLLELYNAAVRFEADIVAGNVSYLLPKNVPKWMHRPGFFNKSPLKTGERKDVIGAGNVCFKLDHVVKFNIRFRSDFRHSGGEDTFFFQELIRKGCKAIHCHEAISYESVPESKANVDWFAKRSFMYGFVKARRYQIVLNSVHSKGYLTYKYLDLYLRFQLEKLFSTVTSREAEVRVIQKRSRINGFMHALKGKELRSYDEIHGN